MNSIVVYIFFGERPTNAQLSSSIAVRAGDEENIFESVDVQRKKGGRRFGMLEEAEPAGTVKQGELLDAEDCVGKDPRWRPRRRDYFDVVS